MSAVPETLVGVSELLRAKREEREATLIPFYDWAMQVPEPKAGKLDFDRFPFQRELYGERGAMDAEGVVKKATQMGISAWALRWALYHADVRARTALYVFPKRQQMHDFADSRVKAAIQASPYLRKRIPSGYIANKGLKQVGAGWVYARGSESKADLDAVDADNLVLDEYDTLRQENIPDAERRITGSVDGKIRRVGVPSYPGVGIDALYAASDRSRWFVKCGCGEYQTPTYDDNVHEGQADEAGEYPDAELRCSKCAKRLDTSDGEWVAEYPDRAVRGYHLPRLIVPNVALSAIVKAHHKTAPFERQVHFNKDLAEAYAPTEGRLSAEAIQAATRDELPAQAKSYNSDHPRFMGVDVASARNLHVRVSEYVSDSLAIPLFVGEAEDFSEVVRIVERYQPHLVCIDAAPEFRLSRQLAAKFPGRVWLARYSTTQRLLLNPDEALSEVTVRRTEMIDATLDTIRGQRCLLPGNAPDDLAEHLQNAIRVVEDGPSGRKTASYTKTGPDDYLHAHAYCLLAREVFLWLQMARSGSEGEKIRLEDEYEFERAALDTGATPTYDPGFEED